MKTPESTKNPTLRPRQAKALESLAAGNTQREAAEYAGVNECSVSAWMQKDDFRAALAAAQAERRRAALTHLDALVPRAMRALAAILDRAEAGGDEAPRDTDVIRAIETVLDRTGVLKGQTVTMQDGAPADPQPQRTPEEVANALQDELSSLPVEMLAQALAEAQQLQGGPVGEAK